MLAAEYHSSMLAAEYHSSVIAAEYHNCVLLQLLLYFMLCV